MGGNRQADPRRDSGVRQGGVGGSREGRQMGQNLEADPRRGSGSNSLQLLQGLLPLCADVLQHAPLCFPLEVIVHHLVQSLVVIPVIHPALEASQLTPVSREQDAACPLLAHGPPPHAHLL